ncbi:BamA/TamA family outer membrane protein [Mangrovibacterium diazotrophicum]|uniref:Surface antigen-like protein n=1 Tax=Mangrovibacterium diazotrophicum TaxID=1261403 RepID=A0A419W7J6_9BACT|nr:BamA/TamA family outer membrane protein [Mangrovibacterium diazotrophicum]RKD91443.1 surface antigen-like protein [Mangrovibacterium diazotrophicum]
MTSYKILLTSTLVLLISTTLPAQSKLSTFFAKREAQKQQAFDEGKPWLSPIIAPAYTADAGFLVSGGMLYSFRLNKNDSISQRSSLPATIFYSSKGNFGIRAFLKTFWLEDKLRINTELTIRDKDNNYYGKGFDQIDNNYQSDSTTLYHETNSSVHIELIYKIKPSVFVGLLINPAYVNTKNFAPLIESDPYKSQFDDSYFLSGIGAQLTYDSRDLVVNAWRGMYFNLATSFYDGLWGSEYEFRELQFDSRYYRTISRPGNVLAFRFYTRATYGDVPITELSDFSGGKNLRGYLMGHYRDKTTAFMVTEWRRMFLKSNGKLSKSGMVLWLGSGSIGDNVADLTKWVPNGGVGYRFELQPRMNVCIDFGMGKDSQGVYFNFNEAF